MVFSKGQIRFSICLIWSKSVHIEQRERVDGNPLKASASSWNGQELLLFDKVTGSTGCHFEGDIGSVALLSHFQNSHFTWS